MCRFCNLYENAQNDARERKEKFNIDTVFRIKLVETKYKNGESKGSSESRRIPVHYCPMCGRKI